MKLKREMNSTSSQDEFAKWAKLRRRHDKALEEFEAMSTCSIGTHIDQSSNIYPLNRPDHLDTEELFRLGR